MDDEAFKNMEQRIFNYFNRDKRISILNKKLEVFKKQIAEIEYKLKNIDIEIPEELRAVTYEERVQTSPTGESYAEKALMNITDRLLKEQTWKKEQVEDIEEALRNMEIDNAVIETNIKDLEIDDQKFLKERYKYNKKDWQLGMEFNMSSGGATKRRHRLIRNIINCYM